VYYYLKIIIAMYFKTSDSTEAVPVEKSNSFVIAVTALIVLAIGVVPGLVAEMFKF
jgi:NADH:ubiquinone oxidoreductase subunit 2 (subunit N)